MGEITLQKALQMAMELHESGHFQRAQDMYVSILEQDPGNVDAIHLLGVLAHHGNRSDLALDYISRAIEARPNEPVFHFNLADCYAKLQQPTEAIEHLETAVKLAPDYYNAWYSLAFLCHLTERFDRAIEAADQAYELAENPAAALVILGLSHRSLNDLNKALESFQEAVAEDPKMPQALTNLGMLLAQMDRVDEALEFLKKAVEVDPIFGDAHNNLGIVYLKQMDFENAAKHFNIAIQLKPNFADAYNNLGVMLRDSGRPEEAISCYNKAIELNPEFYSAFNNLATANQDMGNFQEAIKCAQKAIEGKPDFSEAYFNLAQANRMMGKLDEAAESFAKAAELAPTAGSPFTMLGYVLVERGEVVEGLKQINRGLSFRDDPKAYGDMLLALNYTDTISPEQNVQIHKEVGQNIVAKVKQRLPVLKNLDPERKLRIGYVSGDFRLHSVYFFAGPLIENHDKSQFEIALYSGALKSDAATISARAHSDLWRETVGVSDDDLCNQIVSDEIDILVDLSGFTGLNRLLAFAQKPAPIQISAIGYPSTTGCEFMDYRITDSYCDPTGNEVYSSEKLLRMDPSFWCYRPNISLGEVHELPAKTNGFVTFVSTNNLSKISESVLKVWAEILMSIPGSKLIIQSAGTGNESVKTRINGLFSAAGVTQDRYDLRGFTSFDEFSALLDESDIVLDPWPFNGGTTSCHSLYKGLPMITLEGILHAGRMGVSLLNNVGLPEFIAKTTDEYVEIAVSAASDIDRLSDIRANLRANMLNSPLCDSKLYVENFENALRQVWRDFCRDNS